MDKLKGAFFRIKKDIGELRNEVSTLRKEISLLSESRTSTNNNFCSTDTISNDKYSFRQTDKRQVLKDPYTKKRPLEAIKIQKNTLSIGNRGVSTDRQTDRQTDNEHNLEPIVNKIHQINRITENTPKRNSFDATKELVENIGLVRRDLNSFLKRLTTQEFSVFCTIYFLENNKGSRVSYNLLANELSLTESSIRDYINRLLKKGAPLEKEKINNKQILVGIEESFKKLVPLPHLLSFQEKKVIR